MEMNQKLFDECAKKYNEEVEKYEHYFIFFFLLSLLRILERKFCLVFNIERALIRETFSTIIS